MPNPSNRIPIDLRNKLDADADRAAQAGDKKCAEILRQLGAYDGNDGAQHARTSGQRRARSRACVMRELMQLSSPPQGPARAALRRSIVRASCRSISRTSCRRPARLGPIGIEFVAKVNRKYGYWDSHCTPSVMPTRIHGAQSAH